MGERVPNPTVPDTKNQELHVIIKPANLWWAGTGATSLSTFLSFLKLTKQCRAVDLMENYILKSSVDLGLGFIQVP